MRETRGQRYGVIWANAILAACGGVCGLAFFIFMASFIGLLPV